LRFDNPAAASNPRVNNFVKFDGIEADGVTLIDRKLSLTTFPKQIDSIGRASQALRQNPNFRLVYEFPSQQTADRALQILARENITNISIRVELRRRASVEEPIKKVHEEFSIFLHEFDKPWGYKGLNVPDVDLSAAELIFVVMLDDLCSRGCKSYISYKLRNKEYLQDNAQYDDYLIIEFKFKDQDFSVFLERVLPSYIRAFNCYRASIINCNLALQDWPEIVEQCNSTGRDINGRDGVYRINEINFFDRELCKRAFNLTYIVPPFYRKRNYRK